MVNKTNINYRMVYSAKKGGRWGKWNEMDEWGICKIAITRCSSADHLLVSRGFRRKRSTNCWECVSLLECSECQRRLREEQSYWEAGRSATGKERGMRTGETGLFQRHRMNYPIVTCAIAVSTSVHWRQTGREFHGGKFATGWLVKWQVDCPSSRDGLHCKINEEKRTVSVCCHVCAIMHFLFTKPYGRFNYRSFLIVL